jgi:hypothetical protein
MSKRRIIAQFSIVALSWAAVGTINTASAGADSEPPDVEITLDGASDAVANLPPAVAIDAAELIESPSGTITADAGTADVSIPSDPDESIQVVDGGDTVRIGLPDLDLGDAELDPAGDLVLYPSGDDDAGVTVEAVEGGGLRTTIVVGGPNAPTRYRFQVGVEAGSILMPDGSGGIVALSPSAEELLRVSPAWAYDADGRAVPTHFELDGSLGVVQVVEHGGFTYPVLADPCWTCILDTVAATAGFGFAVAAAFVTCPAWCVIVGIGFATYGLVRWIQGNYASCRGKRITNPWREAYYGCR